MGIIRKPSLLWASPSLAVWLIAAAAIAVILFTASVTITNAQQSLASQPGAIQNGTFFQSTEDSFRVQVPEGWVIQDVNNTGSKLIEESTQGYGILAEICPEEQQQGLPNVGSGISSGCQGSNESIIHIIRYPNLDTNRPQVSNNNNNSTNDMTADNNLLYHLQKLQEVGYRGIQIANVTETTVNVTNPQTNQTITTAPAKLVEMTYSTNLVPNEARKGYFILTTTNATTPNLGTMKGYSVFYEGNFTNSSTAATPEITATSSTVSGNLASTPLPPAVGQIFDSFELIVASEVAQELARQATAQSVQTTDEGADEDNGEAAQITDNVGYDNNNDDEGSDDNNNNTNNDDEGSDDNNNNNNND
ncbi:MAG TPA: hypothetical protein VFS97_11175, partial [Nitrososphaeraceae archaeon]|nr:hypothetical protein [Nitrososphaeraceae archaeon]